MDPTFQIERPLSRADYRALATFRYEIRRFLHFSEEAARAEGFEPQQHQLLLAIAGLEDGSGLPTISQLASYLLLKHHSVVGLVDRLEQRGMIERIRDSVDHRQVRIRMTATGLEKLHHLSRIHREELRRSGPGLVKALGGVLASNA